MLPGFRILKSVWQGEHLIHHETQGGVCNLSIVAPALTFPQSKISTAFLEYDLYAPASFVKFKGSDEVHGSICSKQHFPMGASSVFDDEDAYGLFARFCMKLNVFALVLSTITGSCAFIPCNQFMDVLGTFGLACLITVSYTHLTLPTIRLV